MWDSEQKWYAIQVRSRFEFVSANILHSKGFEPFVPRYRSKRRWSDRNKELDLPLFPGYIFCRFDARACRPIITTAGVVRIVGTSKTPSPLEPHEIEAIQGVMQHGCKAEPHPYMPLGSRVRIQEGPLAGLEAILTGHKNRRLIFSIELVQRSISVALEDWAVTLISRPPEYLSTPSMDQAGSGPQGNYFTSARAAAVTN